MSNPFDQFSSDIQAALPGAPPPAPDAGYAPYQVPPPASPARSVMNAPPQQTYGAYGQPQPGYGAPPPQQGYGAPPPAGNPFGGDSNPYGQQLVPAEQQNNPYALPPGPPPAPQSNGYGPPPADSGNPYGAPPPTDSSNPYGAPSLPDGANPYGAPPPGGGNPYGAPPPPDAGNPYGAPPPPSGNPYGAPQDAGNPYGAPPDAGNPYGVPPDAMNPYGAPPSQGPPGPPANDPWGAPAGPPTDQYYGGGPPPDPYAGALVPAQPPVDPFSVFNSAPAPPPQPPAPAPVHYGAPPPGPPPGGDDMFGMGFDAPAPAPPAPIQPSNSDGIFDGAIVATEPGGARDSSDLPPGGEWYDARIFTPTLGVMFFKPRELTDSLFLHTDRDTVDALGERPVVAFIVEGSSARSAGVELGHVLLKVNGVDVRNPKEASRLIKEGPRPLPLLFYVPNTEVVVAEGEHMVKYDTRDTTAPNSAKDWKPKYVVIGGIIAQPWMMNMYRSKSEYDIAVIETQARRPVSVKVKQFSLQGGRIQNDWQGPQMVKYKNKLHPWKYIVILPVARNPIKISSPNLSQLKPVHEGIRRVLLSQQRDRGSNPHTAGPVRSSDPYGSSPNGRGPERQTSHASSSYSQPPAPPPAPAPAPQPPVVDLIGGFDVPAPAPQYGGPPPQQQQYGGPPPQQYGGPPQQQFGAPPPPQQQYGGYVQQPYNNY